MTGAASLADRRRRHREELELALAENISLDSARARRFEERMRAIEERRCERDMARAPITTSARPEPRQQWWQRDDL